MQLMSEGVMAEGFESNPYLSEKLFVNRLSKRGRDRLQSIADIHE